MCRQLGSSAAMASAISMVFASLVWGVQMDGASLPSSAASGDAKLGACCYVDENDLQQCDNTTFDDCLARKPIGLEEKWLQGKLCGETAVCPIVTCLASDESCRHPHPTPGCNDYSCCENICREDDYCCAIEWDDQCVSYIAEGLCELPPENVDCPHASLLSDPEERTDAFPFGPLNKTTDICCYTGGPAVCLGGKNEGLTCQNNEDCIGGMCGDRPSWVYGSLWFKFVATNPSVVIHTCNSSAPGATDSILQLFAAADETDPSTACSTLMPVACSDDVPGCGPNGKLSHLCAQGLEVGRTYYLLAGSKSHETQGEYHISLRGPCTTIPEFINDWCHQAAILPESTPASPAMAFDLVEAGAECGNDVCFPDSTSDLWYEFTPECGGWVTMETCGAEGETTLEAYDGCDLCPPLLDSSITCSVNQHCGPDLNDGRIEFPVAKGGCYKVRLATNSSAGEGTLRASVSSDCFASYVEHIDPPASTVDARRPYPPGNPEALMGIDRLLVDTTGGDCKHCWLLCEGALFPGFNTIEANDRVGDLQEILLGRPLTPWAITKIKHVPWGPPSQAFVVRPGDVDASGVVDPFDVIALMEGLNGTGGLSIYSCDIDHSGRCTPLDLLDWIDGANVPAYDGYTWLNHPFAPEPFCD